jgi:SAM-dependent methyltransferase
VFDGPWHNSLFFLDALDLLDQPQRAPGWNHTNPDILEAQGRFSRAIITRIAELGAEQPDLETLLNQPGAFLDVGTGVGHLAIEAARTWPTLHVVGLDVWKPSLTLARAKYCAERASAPDRITGAKRGGIEGRRSIQSCVASSAVYTAQCH